MCIRDSDKADVVVIPRFGGGSHLARGLVQFGAALVVFGADIQQADPGAEDVHAVSRVRGAHRGILQKVIRLGLDVGAHVQHHV